VTTLGSDPQAAEREDAVAEAAVADNAVPRVPVLSAFDLFRVGIGPSSSHTVGPMCAAYTCVADLVASGRIEDAARVGVDLLGSLAATGRGHGTDTAVLAGLSGLAPTLITTEQIDTCQRAASTGTLMLAGTKPVALQLARDVRFVGGALPAPTAMGDDPRARSGVAAPSGAHPNALRIRIQDRGGADVMDRTYYSVGGGFVVPDDGNTARDAACGVVIATAPAGRAPQPAVPYPFTTSQELLAWCGETGLDIAGVMAANEAALHPGIDVAAGLRHLWYIMNDAIEDGLHADGTLPGDLSVPRRAPHLYAELTGHDDGDPARVMDWLSVYAMAVAEQNASGARIVTAPTNGAAAVIPAVLRYHLTTYAKTDAALAPPAATDTAPPAGAHGGTDQVADFLLAAAAVGILIKTNASLAGAEVGCQGEIGSACSMAAAGLAQVLGGTPQQVENAAEIAMEHNLGLTCDPIGGLVQIPCIERNAIAAVTALSAARMALRGDGRHMVSLDTVIKTMRQTGLDMNVKYKETSLGGLAVNWIEC